MKTYVLLILLFLPPLLSAETATHGVPSQETCGPLSLEDTAFKDAVDGIATFLKPFISTLNRDVDTYHFVRKEELISKKTGKFDVTSPEVVDHVEGWSTYFWNLGQRQTGHTRGLYLALDPVASRSFGGKDWGLYRLTYPKGHRVLDIRSMEKKKLPVAIQDLLVKAGCSRDAVFKNPPDSPLDEIELLLKSNEGPVCRKLGTTLLKRLEVDSILYDYAAEQFEGSQARERGAFILLRPSSIPKDNIQAYFADEPSEEKNLEERKRIGEMYRLAKQANVPLEAGSPPRDLPLFPGLGKPEGSLQEWMKHRLFDSSALTPLP